MRYSPKRNYPYPVLRPYSRDYGDTALFSTELGPPAIDAVADELIVSLNYKVNVSSLSELLDTGNAVCAAMLYCPSTLFRTLLQADVGSLGLNAKVPLSALSNQVEIHPSIIANGDFSHTFEGKLEEYGEREWEIARGKPLAADQSWHFSLEPKKLESTESIFQLRRDENIEGDEVRVNVDRGARYVVIYANPRTFERLQSLRNQGVDIAIVSIYLGPLMEALRMLISIDDEDEGEEGPWVAALRAKLSEFGLLPLHESNLFQVAQGLFGYPYGRLTTSSPSNEDAP